MDVHAVEPDNCVFIIFPYLFYLKCLLYFYHDDYIFLTFQASYNSLYKNEQKQKANLSFIADSLQKWKLFLFLVVQNTAANNCLFL